MTPPARNTTLPRRFYVPRCIGLALGFLAIYPGVRASGTVHAGIAMLLLATYCFLWPHAAYALARTSSRPNAIERRNMLFDAFAAGFFAGVTGCAPIASVAVVSMVSMNNMAMGGPRFMGAGLAFSVIGGALAWCIFDPALSLARPANVLSCVPLLMLYPLSLGHVCYRTAKRLQHQKKQLHIMSRTDYLTGLLNRSALNDVMECLSAEAAGNLERNVVALVDVDGFKQINDRLGHGAGDGILRSITDILRSCARAHDTIGRYGGDEFCVVLRNVSRAEAARIFENMRARAHAVSLAPGPASTPAGTLSIGAVFCRPLSNGVATWIDRADHAMYEAKKNGRNQVVFSA